MFVKQIRDISVSELRIVQNVEKCNFQLTSGCMCARVCVCVVTNLRIHEKWFSLNWFVY